MSDPLTQRGKATTRSAARAVADEMTDLIEQADAEDFDEIRREMHTRIRWVKAVAVDQQKKRAVLVLKELGLLNRQRRWSIKKPRRRFITPATGDPDAEAAFSASSEPRDLPRPEAIQFDRILSAPVMAQRLGMSKPTVFKQMRAGQLVGWLDQRNRGCFPAGQLDRFGRVTPGIPQILEQFSDPMVAWWWLTGPRHSLEDRAPLDLLKSDEVERAIDAARGYAMGAFG